MPIKGLTERRRLPRLGKIHLGVKVLIPKTRDFSQCPEAIKASKERKTCNHPTLCPRLDNCQIPKVEYPSAVDYFVCPPVVQGVFGEKPRELRILIPLEDEERWASQYYRCYSRTRGLVCKGDGEQATCLVDIATGAMAWKDDAKAVSMRPVPCKGQDCPDYGEKCKEVMNLQFMLPEVPGLGIWQIDTGSINSIRNINDAADLLRFAHGRISLLPLLLRIEPLDVTPEGKKKTVYVLNLRSTQTLLELRRAARPLLAVEGVEGAVEMPIPDDETPELIIPANQAPPETKVEPAKPSTMLIKDQEKWQRPGPGPVTPVTSVTPARAPARQQASPAIVGTGEARRGVGGAPAKGPAPFDIETCENFGQLVGAALNRGVHANEVFARAGVKAWKDFPDFKAAWAVVEELVAEKASGAQGL